MFYNFIPVTQDITLCVIEVNILPFLYIIPGTPLHAI